MIKALRNPLISLLALMAFGAAAYFGFNDYIQLMLLYIMVNCLMAMSLNLVNGYTGQFSLGHAGFMAVGAYFSAYANSHWSFFPAPFEIFNFLYISIGAGLLAAAAGFLVGQPSLRLKGDYLAIVTLGFGEIIRVALLNMDFLGGARGYSGIPGFPNNWMAFSFASFWVVICFYTIWRILHSTHGRAFLSVREDEIAAEAMGVNTTKMKVRAFMISSFFAGVAGALFANITHYVSPASFTFLTSVNAVIMVVLGGMGSMSGSIVAAVFITLLPELLRPLQDWTGIDLRMIIYSLSLIIIMILRPAGLFGESEINQVFKKWRSRGRA